MPKFKVGDRISNGKTEYTVLNIETNENGNLCYRFNNLVNRNFLWATSEVDQMMFELVKDNDYPDYWKDFRAKAAKEFTIALIPIIDYENTSDENIVKNAIRLTDELIKQLQENEENHEQDGVVKAIANKYKE